MASIIVGDRAVALSLSETIGEPGNSRIWAPTEAPDDPAAAAVAELARALEELETLLSSQEFDRVLLADDSEEALAAALVATKLLLELQAADGARDPESANGRLIAQLADAYTEPA